MEVYKTQQRYQCYLKSWPWAAGRLIVSTKVLAKKQNELQLISLFVISLF